MRAQRDPGGLGARVSHLVQMDKMHAGARNAAAPAVGRRL
jgi:hypothetical protein